MSVEYEVHAIRFGTWSSTRAEQFYRYGVYGEPDAPLDLDYFFWVIRSGTDTILVDTGYHPDAIRSRPGRICEIAPTQALERFGVEAEEVSRIIVSHFHFDHIGNLAAFPNARLSIQRRELDFWAGPHGARLAPAASVERNEIDYIAEANRAGRVDWLDGDGQVAPAVHARLVGGHCPGQQVVVVDAERPVVIASDALHFYEEMERYMPFEVFTDLPGMYATYDLLRELRDREDAVIVAGHDPLVMERFPASSENTSGMAVRVG